MKRLGWSSQVIDADKCKFCYQTISVTGQEDLADALKDLQRMGSEDALLHFGILCEKQCH